MENYESFRLLILGKDMCDVTTYVTPTVGSLAIRNRIIYMCLLVGGKRRGADSWFVEPAAT